VVLASGATEVSSPYDIATDGTYVYWTNNTTTGSVGRIPTGGGTYLAVASNVNLPQDITTYNSNVYFTATGAGASSTDGAQVWSVTNAGGSLTKLDWASRWFSTGDTSPAGIAFDKVGGNTLYWVSDASAGAYNVFKYVLSTSTGSVEHTSSADTVAGIGADNVDIVYTVPQLGWVVVLPADSVYDNGNVNSGRVTAVGGHFYYLIPGNGPGTGAIHSRADSSSSFSYVAMNLNQPTYITSDGTNVYWTDTADNAIYRTPVGGGPIFTLVKQTGVAALTMDTTYVYFINKTTSEILRVPK
jgi:hypothetical protein